MGVCGVTTIWVYYHGNDRAQHSCADDEGKGLCSTTTECTYKQTHTNKTTLTLSLYLVLSIFLSASLQNIQYTLFRYCFFSLFPVIKTLEVICLTLLCELKCVSLYVFVLPSFPSLVLCVFVFGCVSTWIHIYVCIAIHSFASVHWFTGINVCTAHVCLFLVWRSFWYLWSCFSQPEHRVYLPLLLGVCTQDHRLWSTGECRCVWVLSHGFMAASDSQSAELKIHITKTTTNTTAFQKDLKSCTCTFTLKLRNTFTQLNIWLNNIRT